MNTNGERNLKAPMLLTATGCEISLCNLFRSSTAFLICSGPSLANVDLSCLNSRGILTCSVNNAGTQFRSNLWVSYDSPGKFSEVIWRDPAIWKFVPIERFDKPIRTRNPAGNLEYTNEKVNQMPSTFGYRANCIFQPETWLTENSINCGDNESDSEKLRIPGARSVMLVALRLLHYLGVRRVFLLGCDFGMSYGSQNYAFEQTRTRRSVKLNNQIYRTLSVKFEQLLPYFKQDGFEIFNCNPDSGLRVFPFVDLDEAIGIATSNIPCQINTYGMYDERPID
jgi:hypothetical protein